MPASRALALAASVGFLVATGCAKENATPAVDTTTPVATTPAPAPVSTDNDPDDRIEDALEVDSALSKYDIDAEEDDGTIKLEGEVRTAEEKARAEEIARTNAGGATIASTIEVKADAKQRDGAPDDADDRIEEALKADAALSAFNFDVDDNRRGISLKGTVQTAEQKAAAEAVAKRIAPTATIENKIVVQP